jgi:hypothetical protein
MLKVTLEHDSSIKALKIKRMELAGTRTHKDIGPTPNPPRVFHLFKTKRTLDI